VVTVEYPFGFEGFGDRKEPTDLHLTDEVLKSYCERSLHTFAEIGQDEFMKIEGHVAVCDVCLMVLINKRIELLADAE
jgi:hypothetical protein